MEGKTDSKSARVVGILVGLLCLLLCVGMRGKRKNATAAPDGFEDDKLDVCLREVQCRYRGW